MKHQKQQFSQEERNDLKRKLSNLEEKELNIRGKSPLQQNIKRNKERSKMMAYSHLGIEFGLSIILPVLLGNYLDKKFNISPLILIIGLILGFTGGLYRLIHITSQMNEDE